MRHKLWLFSLIAAGLGSMIGSGWLFSSYYVATGMQGSGAYAVWITGGIIIMVLVLALAEIVTMHPKRGGFTRLLTLAYNHDVGYITALANWFGMLVVIPTEAEATVQYLSTVQPTWEHYLFFNHQLTFIGVGMVIFWLYRYSRVLT